MKSMRATLKETRQSTKDMQKRLRVILSSYQGKKDELIPILQKVQDEFGYLPKESLLQISRLLSYQLAIP